MTHKNDKLIVGQTSQGVASLILNRPEIGNAFDAELIQNLIDALKQFEKDGIRLLQLKSNGRHFSAGADLNWMKQAKSLTRDENYQDSQNLAELLSRLNNFPAPTLAVVQGAAYGGAVGLVSACDIAIGAESSRFCLSEVKIGLIPAVISPYVVAAMGERQARRYFLSAEIISSHEAVNINLLHERCADEDLTEKAEHITQQILANSPQALVQAKKLIQTVNGKVIDQPLIDLTCERIADIRVSEEGQEGLASFLEKREPSWRDRS